MEEILGILEETPWWVFLVFAYLIAMGVRALNSRTVSIKKLFALPAIFTIWGLAGMQLSPYPLLAWVLSLAIGFPLGWFSIRKWKIRYDRGRGTLYLPGSRSTLILALIFFSIKYYFGFYNATHVDIPLAIYALQSFASGLISGIFIGRLAYFWKKYEQPYTQTT